jgi:hypothetical protein
MFLYEIYKTVGSTAPIFKELVKMNPDSYCKIVRLGAVAANNSVDAVEKAYHKFKCREEDDIYACQKYKMIRVE